MNATLTALQAIVEYSGDRIKTRAQTVHWLHVEPTYLGPAGLSGDRAAEMLRRGASRDIDGSPRPPAISIRQSVSPAARPPGVRDRNADRGQDPRDDRFDRPFPSAACVRQRPAHAQPVCDRPG